MGVLNKVLVWITEWLTGRRQKVVLNGNKSEWEWMALFLIISNDLESVAEGREGHRRT